jgi:hypothetical protein
MQVIDSPAHGAATPSCAASRSSRWPSISRICGRREGRLRALGEFQVRIQTWNSVSQGVTLRAAEGPVNRLLRATRPPRTHQSQTAPRRHHAAQTQSTSHRSHRAARRSSRLAVGNRGWGGSRSADLERLPDSGLRCGHPGRVCDAVAIHERDRELDGVVGLHAK